ncbi:winged helix-turn-helix domain-containing protein [Arenimonas daejeonensis]|uniref:winged helix-turn-helix domain-containing protein n=1 Tax=Arenimonas daejeonensis TaxID=370777 RepID=UPI001D13FAE1|nr:transcriptional regulator [Arenimonas daejeonensis]
MPDPTGAFRFGRFELHPAARLLLRDGQPVELQAKVFDFIAYLLAHRGRAVEKNELLDAVWPRQVVTEAALSRCVMKARRAVDDEADDPAVILTVHGRGYRFIAAVEPILERRGAARSAPEPEAGEPAADDTPQGPQPKHPNRRCSPWIRPRPPTCRQHRPGGGPAPGCWPAWPRCCWRWPAAGGCSSGPSTARCPTGRSGWRYCRSKTPPANHATTGPGWA